MLHFVYITTNLINGKQYVGDHSTNNLEKDKYLGSGKTTLKFAIKAAYAIIGGVGVDVYKDPITAKGSKKSKRGILRTIYNPEFGYKTINQYDTVEGEDMLQLVFLDGDLFNIQTYEDILHTMSIDEQKLDNLVKYDRE